MAAPDPEPVLLASLARLVLLLALLPAAVAVALGGDALAAAVLAAIPVGVLALRWRGGQLVASGLVLLPACGLLHEHAGLMLVPSALGLVALGLATRAELQAQVTPG